jgi:hypothetical protein
MQPSLVTAVVGEHPGAAVQASPAWTAGQTRIIQGVDEALPAHHGDDGATHPVGWRRGYQDRQGQLLGAKPVRETPLLDRVMCQLDHQPGPPHGSGGRLASNESSETSAPEHSNWARTL